MEDYREGGDPMPEPDEEQERVVEDLEAVEREIREQAQEPPQAPPQPAGTAEDPVEIQDGEIKTAIMIGKTHDGKLLVMTELEGIEKPATAKEAYDLISEANDQGRIHRIARAVEASMMPQLRELMGQMARAMQSRQPFSQKKKGGKPRVPSHARGVRP